MLPEDVDAAVREAQEYEGGAAESRDMNRTRTAATSVYTEDLRHQNIDGVVAHEGDIGATAGVGLGDGAHHSGHDHSHAQGVADYSDESPLQREIRERAQASNTTAHGFGVVDSDNVHSGDHHHESSHHGGDSNNMAGVGSGAALAGVAAAATGAHHSQANSTHHNQGGEMSATDRLHHEIEQRAKQAGTHAHGFGTSGGEGAPMLDTTSAHHYAPGARDSDVPGYDGDGVGPTGNGAAGGFVPDQKTSSGYPNEKSGYAGMATGENVGVGSSGLAVAVGTAAAATHSHHDDDKRNSYAPTAHTTNNNVVNDDEGVGQVSRGVVGGNAYDQDYDNRRDARVIPHEQYEQRYGDAHDSHGHSHNRAAVGAGVGAGALGAAALAPSLHRRSTAEERMNDPASAAYAQEQAAAPQGQAGYTSYEQEKPRNNLLPSRSYLNSRPGSAYNQQAEQPQHDRQLLGDTMASIKQQPTSYVDNGNNAEIAPQVQRKASYTGTAKTGKSGRTARSKKTEKGVTGVAALPAVMVADHHNNRQPADHEGMMNGHLQQGNQGNYLEQIPEDAQQQQQYHQQQQYEQQQPQMLNRAPSVAASRAPTQINAGPTTAVRAVEEPDYNLQPGLGRPIGGGGLGAALATSGHKLTYSDKKNLKKEIKTEQKFAKQLQQENKAESAEIIAMIKQCKVSRVRSQKAARFQSAYRTPYEKAIKEEVKAKQRLLKVTNYYNRIAANLESASKEMEIRRNAYTAECQTRDADQLKLDHLRKMKGLHDMEREARHGDSLTKQAQAKRALSMSSRRSQKI